MKQNLWMRLIKYLRKQRKAVTDKDAAIMKSEKARRARAKNKAKPMGKKKGGK